jgi:hypothetical protein
MRNGKRYGLRQQKKEEDDGNDGIKRKNRERARRKDGSNHEE